ncbi:cytochrome P450 [Fusarium solani]|uniref:Cytochrome P450 n=1 Tax=Fusarium solani TaxID=169388 RepID=A0A9P9KE92_FUSSL|nr:cytochrome P450 [Fusarium solani]KAH7258133.1 cytochrome P450 [Fusarium solani]
MCFAATCPTCSKKSWRGCGSHVRQVLDGVPESQWCTCTPRTKIDGKQYPPAAAMQIPGLSWITGIESSYWPSPDSDWRFPSSVSESSTMLLLSPAFIAGAAALLLVIHVVVRLTSAMAKVPGPVVSNFTSLVLKWNELGANRTMYLHDLHKKYGPVVRVAPNEVSFTSAAALKEIYGSGGSGYDKTEFYDLFQVYDKRTMFSTLNKGDHAKRRRMIGDRYANSNVMKTAPLAGIQVRSKKFVERCVSSPDGTADVFVTLHAYACDCVTHQLFHPYGSNCLQNQDDEEMMHQVAADDSLKNRLVQHYSPTLHRVVSNVLASFAKPRSIPLADNFVIENAKEDGAADFTVLNRLKEKNSVLETIDMAAECLDHMAAGIDTTGDVLCFLMWELSQPRSIKYQRLLREEFRNNPNAPFDELTLLDAVLNEGLRCFPAIPMSLPRYVPQGGRVIDGFSLPEKTVVSCQSFSVHRINDDVFPDPDKFYPERWLKTEGDADRRRLQWAFSSGGRGCIGKHLAMAEMKTLLRDVYSQYETEPDESMSSESMAMDDQLISSRPLGKRCLLKFVPVTEEEKKQ